MIDLENFKKTIEIYQEFLSKQEKLKEAGIDILESWLNDLPELLFNQWCKSNFTESGIDLIYWWIFESVEKVIYYDINTLFGKQTINYKLNTIEDLYNYLKTNNYDY